MRCTWTSNGPALSSEYLLFRIVSVSDITDPEFGSWAVDYYLWDVRLLSVLEREILEEAGRNSFSIGRLPKIFVRVTGEEPDSVINDSNAADMSGSSKSIFEDILDY
ncbi:hypothetical protein EAG_04500 [Camponotus floridanus]|uniref:Uncharacterized protein n=1 Tax=Camponotus floridanus TaxID=104421 RepID=E2ANW2_CAMFO|nr:hypothetical protein EAG_04500 [Camponotus floridanus]